MSGRDVALIVIAALTAGCPAGLAGAYAMQGRGRALPGDVLLVAAAGAGCGLYAAIGWGWYLVTAVLR